MYNEIKIHSGSRIHVIAGNLPKVISPLITARNSVETITTNKIRTVENKYLKRALYNVCKERFRRNNVKNLVDLFLCDLFLITKDISSVNVNKLVNEMMLEVNPEQKLKTVIAEYKKYYK